MRGYALGAGLQLALACDVRVFAEGTKVGPARVQVRHHSRPRRHATASARRSGAAKAKELIFTAAQIDADEALRIGLAERLVADDELESTAGALAAAIAAQPPLAVAGREAGGQRGGHACRSREGLRIEAEGQAVCLRSDDMREAIAAFVEQRPPELPAPVA